MAERYSMGQCTAHARSGDRCGRPAVPGATVCRYHGGAAPQVREAAAERLRRLQFPAIDALEELLEAHKDRGTRARVAVAVLDRTGLGPQSTVNVEGSLGERLASLDRTGDRQPD